MRHRRFYLLNLFAFAIRLSAVSNRIIRLVLLMNNTSWYVKKESPWTSKRNHPQCFGFSSLLLSVPIHLCFRTVYSNGWKPFHFMYLNMLVHTILWNTQEGRINIRFWATDHDKIWSSTKNNSCTIQLHPARLLLHRGRLLSIEVGYFLSMWVTFHRGGLLYLGGYSIEVENYRVR